VRVFPIAGRSIHFEASGAVPQRRFLQRVRWIPAHHRAHDST